MRIVVRFARGVWEFIVGDDWTIAAFVAAAIAVTALLAGAGAAAWWVMPVGVFGVLTAALWRSSR